MQGCLIPAFCLYVVYQKYKFVIGYCGSVIAVMEQLTRKP